MPVYTFEGTQSDAIHALNLAEIMGEAFLKCNKERIPSQIALDFNRVNMIGSAADYRNLKTKWNSAKSTLKDYCQGDIAGGLFTAPIVFARHCDPTNEALLHKQNNAETQTHIHDAYLDQKGEPCTLSITVHPNQPDKWLIVIVRHADKNPAEKRVHILTTLDLKKSVKTKMKDAGAAATTSIGNMFNKAMSRIRSQPTTLDTPTEPKNQLFEKEDLQKWLNDSLGNLKIYELLQNIFSYSRNRGEWEIMISELQKFALVTHKPNPFRGIVGNRVDFIRLSIPAETILLTERAMQAATPLDESTPFSSTDLENLTPSLHKTLHELTAKLGARLRTIWQREEWAEEMQDELQTLFSVAAHKPARHQDYNPNLKNKVICLQNLVQAATIPEEVYKILGKDEQKLAGQLIHTLRQMMIMKEASQHARKLAGNFKRPRRRPAFRANQTKFEAACFTYLLDDLAALDKQAKALMKRKCTVVGKQLTDLHTLLNRNLSMMFTIPYSPLIEAKQATQFGNDLLTECKTALKNVADQKLLDQHRGVKRLLQNIFVAVLLLGVIWLGVVAVRYLALKKSGKDSFLICNPTTDSRRLFNTVKQTVDDISIPDDFKSSDRHRELYQAKTLQSGRRPDQ